MLINLISYVSAYGYYRLGRVPERPFKGNLWERPQQDFYQTSSVKPDSDVVRSPGPARQVLVLVLGPKVFLLSSLVSDNNTD